MSSTLNTPTTTQPSNPAPNHNDSISDPQYTVDLTARHRDLASQNQNPIQNFSKPRTTSPYTASSSIKRHADESIPLVLDQASGAGLASMDGKLGVSQRGLGTKVVKGREGEGGRGRYHDEGEEEEEEEEEGRSWKGVRWCCCM
ncbi:MAG: hypothetical protein L6R36_006445 [Xanthoria steineri]|nr:MAG: hypothetical protein L6R36_006445 [Xanthoria steineri]